MYTLLPLLNYFIQISFLFKCQTSYSSAVQCVYFCLVLDQNELLVLKIWVSRLSSMFLCPLMIRSQSHLHFALQFMQTWVMRGFVLPLHGFNLWGRSTYRSISYLLHTCSYDLFSTQVSIEQVIFTKNHTFVKISYSIEIERK